MPDFAVRVRSLVFPGVTSSVSDDVKFHRKTLGDDVLITYNMNFH